MPRRKPRSPLLSLQRLEPRLLLTTYAEAVLASFNPNVKTGSGCQPTGMVMDSSGDLFGVTQAGGPHNYGTLFEIPAHSATIVTLGTFNGTGNGFSPSGSLVLDSEGDIFGTTMNGGKFGYGTLYEYAATSNSIITLVTFSATGGAHSVAGLIADGHGDLLGTTIGDPGKNVSLPTLFAFSTSSNTFITLAKLTARDDPDGSLVIDSAGDIFGTTEIGGSNNGGSIFVLPASSSTLTTVASFNGTNGAGPLGDLFINSDGDLEGITALGGANGDGSIFKLAHTSNTLVTVASFSGTSNGVRPLGDLVVDGSGDIFGVTAGGGSHGDGVVYELFATSNTPTVLYAFNDRNNDAENPTGPLVVDSNGNLYGSTVSGGAFNNGGAVFEISPNTAPQEAVKLVFTQEPPKNATAGHTLTPSIIVQVEDVFGHVVTTDSSSITLALNSTTGTLLGTTTVAATDGVAVFPDLSIDTAGTYNIVGTDGTFTAAISTPLTIKPDLSTEQLSFAQQPTAVAANAKITPAVVVEVVDQFNNIITTSGAKITLSLDSGSGVLKGTTSLNASAGVATFKNLSVTLVGLHTLLAVSPPLGDLTSDPFNVT